MAETRRNFLSPEVFASQSFLSPNVLLGQTLVSALAETDTRVTWNCTFVHNDSCNMTYNGPWGVQNGPFLIHSHPVIRGGYDDAMYALFDPSPALHACLDGQYQMTSQWFPSGSYNMTFWHYLRSPTSALQVNTISGSNVTSLLNMTGRDVGWQLTELALDENQSFQIQFTSTKGYSTSAFVGVDNIMLSGTAILTTTTAEYTTTTATSLRTEQTFHTATTSSHETTTITSEATTTPYSLWTEPTTETVELSTETHTTSSPIEPSRQSLYVTGSCLEDVINHSCLPSNWNVTVNLTLLNSMYPHAGANNIFLGDSSCIGHLIGDYLIFDYGLRECLTSEKISNTKRIYENGLMYVVFDPIFPFLIRQHTWTFSVECDVTLDGSTSSHVHHDVEHHHEIANSSYHISLKFYRDPNFNEEIPGSPLHVNVGDNVYVKVFTTTADQGVKLRLKTCYTTPSANASDTMKYYIIQDGCETDRNTHIISQSSHETTFVFQDFEYISNHEGLDLSCSASFCDSNDYSVQCQQSCHTAGPSIVG